jgi:hypothetical protein
MGRNEKKRRSCPDEEEQTPILMKLPRRQLGERDRQSLQRRIEELEQQDSEDAVLSATAASLEQDLEHLRGPSPRLAPRRTTSSASSASSASTTSTMSTSSAAPSSPVGSRGRARTGCTHVSCKTGGVTFSGTSFGPLPGSLRLDHRKDRKGIGRHLNCCDGAPGYLDSIDGHRLDCPGAPEVTTTPPPPDIFDDTFGLRPFFITVNANGTHVRNGGVDGQGPDWLRLIQEYFEGQPGVGDCTGVEEVGTKMKFRHLHFLVYIQMEDTKAHRTKLAKKLRTVVKMGSGPGELAGKVQVKLAATPQGALVYMSKEARRNFRFVTNTGLTLADFKRMENEHRAKDRGAFGAAPALKRADLLLFARQQVELNNNKLLDFTPWDWALRLIQTKELRMDDSWALCAGKLDLSKVAAVQDLTWNGESATQRKLFEVVEGRLDQHGMPHRNYYFDPVELEVVDPSLVSGAMFNHSYDGLNLGECLELWDSIDPSVRPVAPPVADRPARPTTVKASNLRRWQMALDNVLVVPEDAVLGRSILWLWELLGGVGKSVFASFLRHRRRGLIVGGDDKDIFYTVSQSIQKNHGRPPPIIIVDLSRNKLDTPWTAIESLKNGEFLSGKYQSTCESFRRPHVVVLANRPADGVGEHISADRIVEVELRGFMDKIAGSPTLPANMMELRQFPTVKTYGELEDAPEDSGLAMDQHDDDNDDEDSWMGSDGELHSDSEFPDPDDELVMKE